MIDLPLETYKEGDFEAFNSGGVEKEVGEFLYGMVRVMKPKMILETGTHKGISSAYMGMGLRENDNGGSITTIEFDEHHWDEAERLWFDLSVEKYIFQYKGRVEDYNNMREYDMLFLDSEPEYRFAELVRFYPYLKPGGYIFIHDLDRSWCEGNFNPDHPSYKNWPFGEYPEKMLDLLKSGELVKFQFPNPRGMTGFYRRHPSDIKIE